MTLHPVAMQRLTRVRHQGPLTVGDPRHGTDTGYAAGCREACCRRGHARRRNLDRMRPNSLVSSVGTVRRIQALACLGWSMAEISRRSGRSRTWLYKVTRNHRVQAETAILVAGIYDQLSMTRCTSPTADRTAAAANSRGYRPPLAWNDIDDPAEDPTGWEYQPPNRGDLLHDLIEDGAGLRDACRHLGVSAAALQQWCGNQQLHHLYRALCARDGRGHNQHGQAVA